MRKAEDDHVKITTHLFRISIEEEEDEASKEDETNRRFSITIEADSGVVISGQDAAASNASINQPSINQSPLIERQLSGDVYGGAIDESVDAGNNEELSRWSGNGGKVRSSQVEASKVPDDVPDGNYSPASERRRGNLVSSGGVASEGNENVERRESFATVCIGTRDSANPPTLEKSASIKDLPRRSCLPFADDFDSADERIKDRFSYSAREVLKASNNVDNTQKNVSNIQPTIATGESQKSATLVQPDARSSQTIIPPSTSASPLFVRRCHKAMSALSKYPSDSLGNSPSKPDDDPSEQDNQAKCLRRLTLPLVNVDLISKHAPKSPTYENILSGTSVNPIRRSSIASAAICSSLAPSLLSACTGIPNCLLPSADQKEADASSVSSTSADIVEHSNGRGVSGLKLKLPFLRLHIPVHHPGTGWTNEEEGDLKHHSHHHHHHHHDHHVFPHFHVPTFTFTAPAIDGETGRKFNFGIRRHSQTVSRWRGCA